MEPWQTELDRGRSEAAWDRFLEQYRKLVFAAIRHVLRERDDVMDAFAYVCEGLRADDLRRLRRYGQETSHRARFSTWLVTVVRNLTVDFIRAREGRPRVPLTVASLPQLQQRIHALVFVRGYGHNEAYELIRTGEQPDLRFGVFLRELRAVYAVAARAGLRLPWGGDAESHIAADRSDPPSDPAILEESRMILDAALADLSPEDRTAVQLYVVNGLSADEVARLLDLPGAKAVYNRVYRALARLRQTLEAAGYDRGSL